MVVVTTCNFEVLPQPLFSPYLALSDFYLFPTLKTNLHGRNFGSNEGVIDAVDEYFGDQEEGFYFEGISKPKQRWRKCIDAKGVGLYWEIMTQLLLLVIPKVLGRDFFDRPPYVRTRKRTMINTGNQALPYQPLSFSGLIQQTTNRCLFFSQKTDLTFMQILSPLHEMSNHFFRENIWKCRLLKILFRVIRVISNADRQACAINAKRDQNAASDQG